MATAESTPTATAKSDIASASDAPLSVEVDELDELELLPLLVDFALDAVPVAEEPLAVVTKRSDDA